MNTAGNNGYLYAAYVVVWAIHVFYFFTLASRARRLKREARELESSSRL
ncbi:MAG: CcmD family protein [Acidobacteriota bacterium]|nr:CcmD family protein [Acidobacteriota bacterium]